MENTGSKCDVCLGGEGQASASSQLLPLITKHLGNFMRMKPVRACEGCGQLLTLWDDFSRQARLNLAISRPEAVINSEQCEKYKQLLQADNSTQDLNFPCDSTFVSPTSNKGDIPDSQCPIDSKTEIFTNPEDGSILKSILQLPEKTTGLEENTVAYLRQIKLAPIDIQHFASKKCFEESKPSEASNEDLSHSETTETFACTEESSFTSDFMCKQTQTSTTMKSMEKGKTVLPPAIPLPQFTSIIRMSSVEAKSTAVVSVSKREENNENMLTTPGNFASTENQVAVQQNQIISTVTKRSYANTTKIEYVNLGCLPCPTCSATLPTQKALHEHMMNSCLQNRHSQFICAFCAKQYNSKLGLNYHLMQHFTELSSIPCPVCKAVMASKRTLRSHQLRFHPEELPAPALTPCVFCKVMFFKSVLLKHYNNCRQNNLVVCLKKCNMAEQLSVFACSCCYKIFTNKSDLLHHMESVHKVTYHSSSEAKFTCTLCSHKLEEVQDSIQITEKISVNEGSINSQIISASDTISDSQVSSPSEGMVVNEQKISSSEEIVDSQMLSHVEGISVTCQSPSSTEEIVDVILSPAEVSYVNDQILSSTDNQMQSSNEKIIDNQITSSTVIEDAESVQCQICKRKFTVLRNYVSRVEEVLTSKPTSDSNTFNEFALENNETSRKKIVPSLRQRQHVKTVPKKKLFKCKDCGKIFPYASWLQRHQTTAKHAKEVSPEQVGPDEPNSASEEDNKIANRVEIQQKQSTVATDPQGNETSLSICKLCNRGFDKFSGLLRHLSYHDEKEAKVLKDSLLLERSKSNEAKQIKDKVLVRPITNELTCHMCFKTMENVKQLKYHIHAAHLAKNSRLKCRLCPFRFITPESLNRHMVVHSNSSNNESNLNLATQMDTASGNKMQHSYTKSKYTCKICFKSFNDSYGFQRHKSYNHNFKRQHSSRQIQPTTVIKTFKCKLCQNKYPTVRGLNQHLRRFHNSAELLEKTEEEKVKEFIASNSKTASVAESFKCTLCQNKYPTVRGLNQHLRRFHNSTELLEQPEEEMIVEKAKKCVASSVNNLPCDYCHLVFPSESALETHFQMDHMQSGIENVVSGPIALFESPSKENKIETSVELNAEPEQIGAKQAKKFGCKICNRLFFSKGRLHIHLFNAHQKRTKVFSIAYQCKYCMKQLSNAERLKKHMQVLHASNPHSFQKSNFNCDLCGRGVNTKMGLFRHMLHHRKWV